MPKHRRSRSSGPGLRIALVMVLVIAALGIGYVIGDNADDDGQDVSSGSTSSTSPTTSTSTSLPSADIATAVWPFVDSDTRYTDPVEAARGFATEFVGFKEPTVGPFQQGDSRSGEVEVRTKISTPTTVFVRLMSDDTWWVLGSATADIVSRVDQIQADTQAALVALAEVAQVITEISSSQSVIAAAVEEQAATTAEIDRSLTEAVTAVNQLASRTGSEPRPHDGHFTTAA